MALEESCRCACLNSEHGFINDDCPLLLERSLSSRTGKYMQARMFCFIFF